MDITCIMSRHPIHPPIILPSSAAAHLVGDAAKNNLLFYLSERAALLCEICVALASNYLLNARWASPFLIYFSF